MKMNKKINKTSKEIKLNENSMKKQGMINKKALRDKYNEITNYLDLSY